MAVLLFDRFPEERNSPDLKSDGQNRLDPRNYVNRGSIVFVGFHPDDLDFHAAGLAATLAAAGANVVFVVVTSGEHNGDRATREREQRQAASALGVDRVIFLRQKDGALAKDYISGRLQKLMCEMIRVLKPYAVVSFCPANLTSITFGAEHPDHRYGALALWDAIYPQSREPEQLPWWKFWREPLPGHPVREVLWFGDDLETPYSGNCYLLVADVWMRICKALAQHKSQWTAPIIRYKVLNRASRTARRWEYLSIAEEYHRIVIPD